MSWVCGAGERGNIRRARPTNFVQHKKRVVHCPLPFSSSVSSVLTFAQSKWLISVSLACLFKRDDAEASASLIHLCKVLVRGGPIDEG